MLERKAVYGVMFASLLIVATVFVMVGPVKAPSTRVAVINPTGGNFLFYTGTTKVGHRFNATIWIEDAVNLQALEICLTVNDTLLDITRVWNKPSWDINYVFYGKHTCRCAPALFDNDRDGSNEEMIAGDTLFDPAVTFAGWRLAVIVEFEILYEPTSQDIKVWDYLDIDNIDTYLLDGNYSDIPASKINGYYEYNYVTPVHDVAITDVILNKTVVGQGHIAPIIVTVENQGNYIYQTETFNLTVYIDTTAIGTKTVTNLSSEAKQTLTFSWNTSCFAEGNYTIWAYAEPVTDETDTADNVMTSPIIAKVFLGDINDDNKVDIRDLAQAARSFGTYLGHPEWNPIVDLNRDDKVDIRDLVIVAKNFGQVEQ